MTCECGCNDKVLSDEQQRQINEAIATVEKIFYAAHQKYKWKPEIERIRESALYINSVIALLAAVK